MYETKFSKITWNMIYEISKIVKLYFIQLFPYSIGYNYTIKYNYYKYIYLCKYIYINKLTFINYTIKFTNNLSNLHSLVELRWAMPSSCTPRSKERTQSRRWTCRGLQSRAWSTRTYRRAPAVPEHNQTAAVPISCQWKSPLILIH